MAFCVQIIVLDMEVDMVSSHKKFKWLIKIWILSLWIKLISINMSDLMNTIE